MNSKLVAQSCVRPCGNNKFPRGNNNSLEHFPYSYEFKCSVLIINEKEEGCNYGLPKENRKYIDSRSVGFKLRFFCEFSFSTVDIINLNKCFFMWM